MQPNISEKPAPRVDAGQVVMWVVYDSPADLPGRFVARKWSGPVPTEHIRQAKTLEWLRQQLPIGLSRIERQPDDDDKIVEVWL